MPASINTNVTSAPVILTKSVLDNAIANLYDISNTFRTLFDYYRYSGNNNASLPIAGFHHSSLAYKFCPKNYKRNVA